MVDQETQIRQRVAYLCAIVEAKAPHNPIGDAQTDELFLQYARLSFRPIQHCDVVEAVSTGHELNLLGHKAGFVPVGRREAQTDAIAFRIMGPEPFLQLVPVFADDGVGGLEDRLRGAVVLLQLDNFSLGVVPLEIEYVSDIRQTEAVDGLTVITYYTKVTMLFGKHADEYVLSVIGILVFIHHNVAEPLPVLLKYRRMLLKEADRQIKQIVKINGVDLPQTAGIDVIDLGVIVFGTSDCLRQGLLRTDQQGLELGCRPQIRIDVAAVSSGAGQDLT